MDKGIVFQQVGTLFAILIIGFAARRLKLIKESDKQTMASVLLNLTQPMMIISSFQFDFSMTLIKNAGIVLLLSVAAHAFSIALAEVAFRRVEPKKRSVLNGSAVFSNCGNMGFGVLLAFYGKIGVFYGSIYCVVFNALIWTYGINLFSRQKQEGRFKRIFLNPGTISVVVGIGLFLLPVKLPSFLLSAVEHVGSMTLPLSMLVIGALLAEGDYKRLLLDGWAWLISGVRLLLIPLSFFAVLSFFSLNHTIVSVFIMILAMPVGTMLAIFAERFRGDAQFASRAVALSTLLSMVTIPLIRLLLG